MPLEETDERHLTAAQGYLELGLLDDAANELEEIATDAKCHPEVITVRMEIYQKAGKWEEMALMAKILVRMLPKSPLPWFALSIATRRSESLEAARAVLLEAEKRHTENAMVKFQIACLTAQLGDTAAAKDYLSSALKLNKSLRLKALGEADLAPLWDSLGAG